MQEQFFGLYQVLKEFLSYFSIKMWQLVLRFMSAISSAISSISCIGSTIRLPNAASVPDAAGLTCACRPRSTFSMFRVSGRSAKLWIL
mmetsp:Transcript_30843/g.66484  ORF Transcript_30843/g.66484 Transcript_30843/m.66484 type:complete len:88 (+) Transcript_30843:153-416(+)